MDEVMQAEHKKDPRMQVRQYSQFWNMIINKSVSESKRDINLIAAAYEGGHRLERRDENIYTAFTYGKKLKYEELDDPGYVSKCKNTGKLNKLG
jgi:hypothetical protein